jgi:hypothetical protein
MTGIELPILIYTDADFELEKLGIQSSINNTNVTMFTFYFINAISRYEEDGVEYTSLMCNGKDYVTPLPFDIVKQMINENLYI